MEQKKFDFNSIIGFVLIGLILIWYLYNNQPTPEELEERKAQQEQVEKERKEEESKNASIADVQEETPVDLSDSTALAKYQSTLGAFGYAASLPSAKDTYTVLENDVLYLKINNKGGQIAEVKMKNYVTYDSIPVYLVKDNNASFNLSFGTTDNRTLSTKDLYFEPQLSENGDTKVLSMKLKVSESKYLEYRYELKPGDYLLDFTVRSQGLNGILNSSQPVNLDWKSKSIRHAKSIQYENRYTRLTYQHDGKKVNKLSQGGDDNEEEKDVKWISYRQHFFSSILIAETPFKTANLASQNLVEEESKEAKWTKAYASSIPLELKGGELNYNLNLYYGPTDLKTFNKYKELDLADSIPFGWGIFGWINKHVFTPMYSWLSGFLPYGVAIIIMTILVRLALSPVTYKSYLSQAKMKVLRPEITEINNKFKDEPMKKQQETMKLYNKAGVSPMSGCVPALLQLPIFYALFMFFPTAFALRQKPFLWAEDLSSYDVVANLPFNIPFYGDHVSLFPILASVAIFIYMQMTTGQTMQTQQPGMPNMKFIMYLSPLMMLFFFNNYASGLSLYYFISNLITIFIMLVIKNYIIDDEKIHAKIEENKKKPKKKSRFQQRMQEMMEQAEAQKKARNKR
ncbi:membrane protein insertase YidC [Leptobacterium flavescens]|uniref:Membrane protein insertase YidC n=1 Tax=Leptobacterium flavescens TaxID=472055 RepID=A0A6P0UYF2_9FLAO|nr:membrane protein insertase YidC [Leptobacterium flavescens]NER15476.1 membrane protein insertase YidC [Leptobacterium flavescens]